MDNQHLFELINAVPGLGVGWVVLATALAEWLIWLVPAACALAWWRGDALARRELLQMFVVVAFALLSAVGFALVWPQPRPSELQLGTQYLAQSHGGRLPSVQVAVFWSLALAAWTTRRFAVWSFPLLALGLLVGISRIYLGAQLPFDILAALPEAVLAAALGLALRRPLAGMLSSVVVLYDRAVKQRDTGP